MRLDIRNRTLYAYDWVAESQNEVRVAPLIDDRQHLIAYRLSVAPSSRSLAFTDYWGTRVDAFGVREPHLSLEIVAEAAVETGEARPRPPTTGWDGLAEAAFRDRHDEYLARTPHPARRLGRRGGHRRGRRPC